MPKLLRFGLFFTVSGFILLAFLILSNHFGVAARLANYILILAIVTVFFKLVKARSLKASTPKKIFSGSILLRWNKLCLFRRNKLCLFFGWLGIAVAAFLAFRSIFSSGPAVWGDAPYFYPETFKDFLGGPVGWESRGRLGVAIDLYWIYPLMIIYYFLGILGLGNDLIIRLVFYFPAIFLSFLSPLLLTRYLKLSPIVSFFSVLIYSLNTYFILLIDGGQVGVALAYGLFPLTLLQLYKLTEAKKPLQFFLTLASFMLLVIADVRFAVIAVLTFAVWVGFEHFGSIRKLKVEGFRKLGLLGLSALLLSAYWLIPILKVEPTTGSVSRTAENLISVLHPLFLFAPHWPLNEFGKISPPPWYFAGIPLLIFASFFFQRSLQVLLFTFYFLLFTFLVKGDTGLFGSLYAWAVDTIPLGGAFRDSTKFFAPLILFAGILVGFTTESIARLLKDYPTLLRRSVVPVTILYLVFLVHPAILGKMNGVLAGREFPAVFGKIAKEISKEDGFLRTLWFPEHHPFSFHTEKKPALDAKKLVGLRPFASLNVGTFDVFNFFHKGKESVEFFRLLGIRYLFFPQDTRKVVFDEEYWETRKDLLELVGENKELEKKDWGASDLPVYEVADVKPRIYFAEKLVVVVGSDDIYTKLFNENNNFSLSNQPFLFLEDGLASPEELIKIPSDAAALIFNDKDEVDLVLSFLQNHFHSPQQAKKSQWAVRDTKDFLRWEYEFLIQGVETHEFDYQKGVAFSTVAGEEISFELEPKQEGDYILAARGMRRDDSPPFNLLFQGNEREAQLPLGNRFIWSIEGPLKLTKDKFHLVIKNTGGFQAINTLALIPKNEWEEAVTQAKALVERFSSKENFGGWQKIDYKQINSTHYSVEVKDKVSWLVFTDTYHPLWKLKTGKAIYSSFPFYSAVNGFYVPEDGKDLEIVFEGQKYVLWGLSVSGISLLVLAIVFLWFYAGRNGQHFNGPS